MRTLTYQLCELPSGIIRTTGHTTYLEWCFPYQQLSCLELGDCNIPASVVFRQYPQSACAAAVAQKRALYILTYIAPLPDRDSQDAEVSGAI